MSAISHVVWFSICRHDVHKHEYPLHMMYLTHYKTPVHVVENYHAIIETIEKDIPWKGQIREDWSQVSKHVAVDRARIQNDQECIQYPASSFNHYDNDARWRTYHSIAI